MKLSLTRLTYTDRSTVGTLHVDGKMECWTLEDKYREVAGRPVKEWKVQNETAIPKGTYFVIIDFSNRFQKELPRILDVPGFSGVRIHSGNRPEDTEGCILVGDYNPRRLDWVGQSRITFNKLMMKLEKAYAHGEPIQLEIQ